MQRNRLIILSPAQQELEELANLYSQLVGIESALNITDRILSALQHLENFPLIGSLHRDQMLRKQGYRILIVDKYICIYQVIERNIYVSHIVHGATDYPSLYKEMRK